MHPGMRRLSVYAAKIAVTADTDTNASRSRYLTPESPTTSGMLTSNASIGFAGGEPLLAFEAIRYVVDRLAATGAQATFHLTTNLTLLSREAARFFAERSIHVGAASLECKEFTGDHGMRRRDEAWDFRVAGSGGGSESLKRARWLRSSSCSSWNSNTRRSCRCSGGREASGRPPHSERSRLRRTGRSRRSCRKWRQAPSMTPLPMG